MIRRIVGRLARSRVIPYLMVSAPCKKFSRKPILDRRGRSLGNIGRRNWRSAGAAGYIMPANAAPGGMQGAVKETELRGWAAGRAPQRPVVAAAPARPGQVSARQVPLVTVIIPVHNAAATLSETVETLFTQSMPDWEAVIVDDGSTDATPEVIATLRARDPRIRHVGQAHAGVSVARNSGLRSATTEWILFLDGDDWVTPDFLERMLAAAARSPSADVIYCGFRRVLPSGLALPMVFAPEVAKTPFERLARDCAVVIHSLLLRRAILQETGGFDTSLVTCEDWDLWLRVARMGATFAGLPRPLALYRVREGSASTQVVQIMKDTCEVIGRARRRDPRLARCDPRYAQGLENSSVVENCIYVGAYFAGVEAARGRSGLPPIEVIGPLPDCTRLVDGVLGALYDGFVTGSNRAPPELAEVWQSAEPRLLEICDRFETACSGGRVTGRMMADMALRTLDQCALAAPRTLWTIHAREIDHASKLPEIELPDHADQLYVRSTFAGRRVGEACFAVRGAIPPPRLAQMMLERDGFRRVLGRRRLLSWAFLPHEFAKKIARSVRTILDSRRGRRLKLTALACTLFHSLLACIALVRTCRNGRRDAVHIDDAAAAALAARWHTEALAAHGAVAAGAADHGAADAALADRRSRWNRVFETIDPWNYDSRYEQDRYRQALRMLPPEPVAFALELACAEGHFTRMLAARVGRLLAADISDTALQRARARCAGAAIANVSFASMDLIEDPLPDNADLIVCSEVLYDLETRDELAAVAGKLAAALAPGGRLLMTHSFTVDDDPARTGFDWGGYGAKRINEVFGEMPGLRLERALITPLYRTDLYRRALAGEIECRPEIEHAELASPLEPQVERRVVWGGLPTRAAPGPEHEASAHVPILMYHRIAESGPAGLARYRVHPRAFEQQLRFLRANGFHAITSSELHAAIRDGGRIGGRPVMLTFDDGYADFFDFAWPLLRRYGFTAEVFVPTGKVGANASWDRHHGQAAPLMTWEQIRILRGAGVRFGSHLARHLPATGLPDEELLREGAASRAALEARLGDEVRSVAYPFGAYDDRVAAAMRACGYRIALTCDEAIASVDMDPLALPRLEVSGRADLAAFAELLEPPAAPAEDMPAPATDGEPGPVAALRPLAPSAPEI